MSTEYTPKHRANKVVRTQKVQPVPKHAGEYVPEDRTHERLGAESPSVRRLLSGVVAARAEARALGFTR